MLSSILLASYSQTQMQPPKVAISIVQKSSNGKLQVSIENQTRGSIGFSKFASDWNLDLYEGKQKITDALAFVTGGVGKDGTIFYPPQMLIRLDFDWIVLTPGQALSFSTAGVALEGLVKVSDKVTKATLEYVPPSDPPPDWVLASKCTLLKAGILAEWTPSAGASNSTSNVGIDASGQ